MEKPVVLVEQQMELTVLHIGNLLVKKGITSDVFLFSRFYRNGQNISDPFALPHSLIPVWRKILTGFSIQWKTLTVSKRTDHGAFFVCLFKTEEASQLLFVCLCVCLFGSLRI